MGEKERKKERKKTNGPKNIIRLDEESLVAMFLTTSLGLST
jgi:hypothetical protein